MTTALPLSEADVQRTITEALTLCGWRWVHFQPAQRKDGRYVTPYAGDDGFIDIIAVKEGRGLVIEAKGSRGEKEPPPSRVKDRIRREQQKEWLRLFGTVAGMTSLFVGPSTLTAALEEIAR